MKPLVLNDSRLFVNFLYSFQISFFRFCVRPRCMSDVSRHQYQNVRGDAKLLLATVHLLFHLSLPNNMRTKFKFLHYFDFFEKIHSISVGCMAKQPFDCHLNFNLFTLSIFISKLHKQSCFCLNRAAPQCFG